MDGTRMTRIFPLSKTIKDCFAAMGTQQGEATAGRAIRSGIYSLRLLRPYVC